MTNVASADPRKWIADEPMSTAQIAAVGLATALNALDGFDVLSISFAAPGIANEWGIDRAALGVVLSMELLGMGAGAIVLGRAADRIGRRPIALLCLVIMGLGMLLAATAADVIILSAYRLLTGLGVGGMLAATNAIVAEFSNARRRNLCIVVMGAGYPIGAVVGGSIVSALLSSGQTWHSIFVLGAMLAAILFPLVWFFLPETVAHLLQARRGDTLTRVNEALARMGKPWIQSLPAEAPMATRGGLAQLFASDLARTTVLLTASYFFQILTFYFLVKWTPKLIVDFGFNPAQAAGVLVWVNVGGATGSILLSLLTQWFSVRTLTGVWMIAGALAVVVFGQGFDDLTATSAVALVGGFFLNGANVGLYAIFAQSFPAHLRAGGTGFIIGLGRGGAALGPVLPGFLLQGGLPISMVALAMAAGSLLAAAALFSVRYQERGLA